MNDAPPSIARVHGQLTAAGSPFEVEEIVVDGIARRAWKHGPKTMGELLRRSSRFDDIPFLVHEDRRVTFRGFRRAVQALMQVLAQCGVGQGDRVAIAMRNLPEWPVCFFAATALGAIAVPLNAWWVGRELAFGIRDSGAKVLLADAERWARVADLLEECPMLEEVFTCGAAQAGSGRRLEDLIGAHGDWERLPEEPLAPDPVQPDDPATIFYTSGTTGMPKGVVASHRAALSNITGAAFAAARAALRNGAPPAEPAKPAAQAGALVVVPFFHVTGCFAILCPALDAGNRLVLMHRFEPEPAMRLIQDEKLSWVVGVPTIAWQIAEHPRVGDYDLSSLVSLGYGGAAAAPELMAKLAARLPGAVPGHGWGMTETCGLATTHSGADYRRRPTSCGAPVAVVDIRIMDQEAGHLLPAGEVGELWVAGPNIAKGYWNRPEESAATFVDGWVRTGDLARIDAEGFLYIVDRAKDVVIRGGENIHCIEVENCLFECDGIADAALVAYPHRTLGEVPVAVVQVALGSAVTEAAVLAHCAARLAAFKVPVTIAFQHESLPRNASGKLLKQAIARSEPVRARMTGPGSGEAPNGERSATA
ncbi:MAG: acyl--CoA ligase [Erythrobacter sp.]|uniref:class I adenylate-forming enzyme family protein n=1 Tax=Erythrobacter sp. TaxID=1042 RepID=UPI0025E2F3F7|nr:class I adenylate-forming enzyme family protein [Erythrobacter sp.]MCL9998781.1 acyl--CoA ligase [Erythrobacter sp.]